MTWVIIGVTVGSAVVGAVATKKKAGQDSSRLNQQGANARTQALSDEYASRRESRQSFGALAASMAQAGGGVDEGLLNRSSINAELDALNIRYAGATRGENYFAEARNTKSQGNLMAGAQLLSAAGDIYKKWPRSL